MDLDRFIFGCRGLRISCWIVGIPVLSPFRSALCCTPHVYIFLFDALYVSA
jgi:hypothetical protein